MGKEKKGETLRSIICLPEELSYPSKFQLSSRISIALGSVEYLTPVSFHNNCLRNSFKWGTLFAPLEN